MLEALLKLKSKPRNSNNKYGGFSKSEGGSYEMTATYHGFAALVELYYAESIFGIKNTSMGQVEKSAVISIKGIEEGKAYTEAVNYLLYKLKNGYYGDVDTTAMVITALSKHKDIKGVEEIIKSSIEYINSKQLESAGFESYGNAEV